MCPKKEKEINYRNSNKYLQSTRMQKIGCPTLAAAADGIAALLVAFTRLLDLWIQQKVFALGTVQYASVRLSPNAIGLLLAKNINQIYVLVICYSHLRSVQTDGKEESENFP